MYKNIFKKIFSSVFLIVFLFNFAFPVFVNTAYAQGAAPAFNARGSATAQPPAVSGTDNSSDSACFSYSGFSIAGCITSIFNVIFGLILRGINWLLSGVVFLASLALDFAVYSTVVEFKTNFADLKLNPNVTTNSAGYTGAGNLLFGTDGGGLIYYLWGMIRDFINIVIFITIIYHAVQSMFVGFQDTKNKFISLLVFSIVINFSLLFVQIAIDVSNILALQAYSLAVKPNSTASFYDFRTSAKEGEPKSYGEYIMNSVDMNKLFRPEVGNAIAKAEIEAMENTFFFQLGKFAVYIGMIYIFLFMTGLLFYRAVSFVFAMILAPLITLSVFFSYFGKSSSRMQDFAQEINSKIGKYKGDFYEALVKGPLLIFFIYLVGVFAEAIFTQGAMNTLTDSLNRMDDVKRSGGAFVGSIGVFFKFVFFLILAKKIMEMINEIDFKGSGRLSGWGSKFANYTLGRGIGGLGWAGRNTIGRGVSAMGLNNTFSRMATNATKSLSTPKTGFTGLLSKNYNQAKLGLAQRGLRTNKSLVGGTYDLRNPLAKGGLGNLIKNAAGVDIAGGALGKAETRGYEKIQEEKAAARKKKEDDKTAEIAANFKVSDEEILKSEKKVKVGDNELMLKEMEEIMKKHESNDFKTSTDGKLVFNINGKELSFKNDIFNKENPDGVSAKFDSTKKTVEEDIAKKKKKEFEKARTAQIAIGNARVSGDYLSFDRLRAARGMEEKAEEEHIEHERKSAKEKAEKAKKQKNLMDGSLSQMTDTIFDQIAKLEKLFPGTISPNDTNLKTINDFISEIDNLNNKTDVNKKKLENFNKDGKDKLFKAKEDLLTTMRTYLNSKTTTTNRPQLKALKKQINDAIEKNKKNKENYEATISDKDKKDTKKEGKDEAHH